MDAMIVKNPGSMVDSFGRKISYVRISVTDRCNLRCRYCMAEHMQFLPKRDILSLEEIVELSDIFIARGVRRIRLTGGEPLVRRGVGELFRSIGARIGSGLEEVTLTTNGVLLGNFAALLAGSGVRRINVSLDSRRPARFSHITRGGDLATVLAGIAAARAAGLRVKINMVALAGLNDDEIEEMLLWCDGEGLDLTLIETMPLGDVEEDRSAHFLPLDAVRQRLDQRFGLTPSLGRTGGPDR
jgi:cyclic pyranopterin phosphate synthase